VPVDLVQQRLLVHRLAVLLQRKPIFRRSRPVVWMAIYPKKKRNEKAKRFSTRRRYSAAAMNWLPPFHGKPIGHRRLLANGNSSIPFLRPFLPPDPRPQTPDPRPHTRKPFVSRRYSVSSTEYVVRTTWNLDRSATLSMREPPASQPPDAFQIHARCQPMIGSTKMHAIVTVKTDIVTSTRCPSGPRARANRNAYHGTRSPSARLPAYA
jgi:hypothetical protein